MYIKKEDSKSDTIEPSCYKRYELIYYIILHAFVLQQQYFPCSSEQSHLLCY